MADKNLQCVSQKGNGGGSFGGQMYDFNLQNFIANA